MLKSLASPDQNPPPLPSHSNPSLTISTKSRRINGRLGLGAVRVTRRPSPRSNLPPNPTASSIFSEQQQAILGLQSDTSVENRGIPLRESSKLVGLGRENKSRHLYHSSNSTLSLPTLSSPQPSLSHVYQKGTEVDNKNENKRAAEGEDDEINVGRVRFNPHISYHIPTEAIPRRRCAASSLSRPLRMETRGVSSVSTRASQSIDSIPASASMASIPTTALRMRPERNLPPPAPPFQRNQTTSGSGISFKADPNSLRDILASTSSNDLDLRRCNTGLASSASNSGIHTLNSGMHSGRPSFFRSSILTRSGRTGPNSSGYRIEKSQKVEEAKRCSLYAGALRIVSHTSTLSHSHSNSPSKFSVGRETDAVLHQSMNPVGLAGNNECRKVGRRRESIRMPAKYTRMNSRLDVLEEIPSEIADEKKPEKRSVYIKAMPPSLSISALKRPINGGNGSDPERKLTSSPARNKLKTSGIKGVLSPALRVQTPEKRRSNSNADPTSIPFSNSLEMGGRTKMPTSRIPSRLGATKVGMSTGSTEGSRLPQPKIRTKIPSIVPEKSRLFLPTSGLSSRKPVTMAANTVGEGDLARDLDSLSLN
ncbi:uncharacterized protein VTP21DRAFT_7495 [Calcarisporiella thermophila]|uniref:uncharacterized protein n=1 Tax=Calcarisporiella thermophila TaxID=911321 RepID=UPI0037439C28